MNRADFQQLAEEYAIEAKPLLDAGHFGAAYYLAGYAVECGLKACICRGINQYEFPSSRDFSRECYDHDFRKLLRLAKLESALLADQIAIPNLGASWQDVVIWSEQSRAPSHVVSSFADSFSRNSSGVSLRNSQKLSS